MSRHRRQRNRRFARAIAKVPRQEIDSIVERYNLTGLYPHWARNRPLSLVAAKRSGRLQHRIWPNT